jgi:hypothetical protein
LATAEELHNEKTVFNAAKLHVDSWPVLQNRIECKMMAKEIVEHARETMQIYSHEIASIIFILIS